MVSLCCCVDFPLVPGNRGHSLVAVYGLLIAVTAPIGSMGPRVHGLQ